MSTTPRTDAERVVDDLVTAAKAALAADLSSLSSQQRGELVLALATLFAAVTNPQEA